MRPFLFLLLFLSCVSPEDFVNYTIAENKKYDVPAKSQISRRLVLKKKATKKEVEELLKSDFDFWMKQPMQYHNPPSHIFIYVYDSGATLPAQNMNWVGRIIRLANEDKPLEIRMGF